MKRQLLLSFSLLIAAIASAQFNVVNPNGYVLLNNNATYGVDALVLFNGISSMSEIQYTGSETVRWTYYDGTFCSNQATISPDNATGYIVWINDVATYYVWAIDYQSYLPVYELLEVLPSDYDCESLTLQLTSSIPVISYQDHTNATRQLPRDFTLDYNTAEFSNSEWSDKIESLAMRAPITTFSVTAPLQSTEFKFYGDQWAIQLGLTLDTLTSAMYEAVAIECHPLGVIAERDALNEKDRSSTTVSGSGPLVVDFTSNVNPLSQVFYEWTVWNVLTPNNYMRYSDVDFRYTFNDSGEYYVKLHATSSQCECTDSISVTVRESMLEVPNVFTPNSDGINDEFRVVYRSLATFRMTIFNRWGRIVYDSTDPAKGWDGRIGGRDAAEGAYYYLIEATGTDTNSKGKPIKYKLKGAVSLLR